MVPLAGQLEEPVQGRAGLRNLRLRGTATAHRDDEHVNVNELRSAVDAYVRIAEQASAGHTRR